MVDATNPDRGRRRRRVITIATVVAVLAGAATVAALLQSRSELPAGQPGGGTPGASPAPSPTPSPTPEPGADITGPLNILVAGIDPRVGRPEWRPNADAVMILHVNEALTRAYLFSLPRDLLVEVPAFEPAGFGGRYTKLTHAMSYGSRVPGEDIPDHQQGFALLAETVSRYTGIERFDAGAVLNFPGFTKLVDAVGGVDMYVDQRVVSIHREPDGDHRQPQPGGGGYLGPQKVYEVGEQHLSGWQALDYARQRYIEGGDYARQRHQRQLVKAMVGELFSQELVTNPAQLDRVLQAVGDALVFDGRGHRVIDFAFALQQVRAGRITLVGLPGNSLFSGGSYQGEQLEPVADDFFAAVRQDRVGRFLDHHPRLANREP